MNGAYALPLTCWFSPGQNNIELGVRKKNGEVQRRGRRGGGGGRCYDIDLVSLHRIILSLSYYVNHDWSAAITRSSRNDDRQVWRNSSRVIVRSHVARVRWPFVFFYRTHYARNLLNFLSRPQTCSPHPPFLDNSQCSAWTNIINSPATGPPAAAENEYNKLLMQKAAVVLLLSTTVSRIKHWLVMKIPSLNP